MKILCQVFVLCIITVAAASCAQSVTMRSQLAASGAHDLGCTQNELTLTSVDDYTSRVEGCGRRATYVQECDRCYGMGRPYVCNCGWRIDVAAR